MDFEALEFSWMEDARRGDWALVEALKGAWEREVRYLGTAQVLCRLRTEKLEVLWSWSWLSALGTFSRLKWGRNGLHRSGFLPCCSRMGDEGRNLHYIMLRVVESEIWQLRQGEGSVRLSDCVCGDNQTCCHGFGSVLLRPGVKRFVMEIGEFTANLVVTLALAVCLDIQHST